MDFAYISAAAELETAFENNFSAFSGETAFCLNRKDTVGDLNRDDLYTDMTLYGDTVVFGTAGAGGHFVGLRLADGVPVFDINTKGTDRYLTVGDRFYTYAGGKRGLLSVGIDGSSESLSLPGYTDNACPLWTDGKILLCMSFDMKGGRYTAARINAIDLS